LLERLQVIARRWAYVLRRTVEPARHLPVVVRWWPLIIAILAPVLAAVGLSVPQVRFSLAWAIALVFVATTVLFARTAYRFHVGAERNFPDIEVVIPSVTHRPLPPSASQRFVGAEPLDQVLSFPLRFTNRERQVAVSLAFRLIFAADGDSPELFEFPHTKTEANALPDVVNIGPMSTEPTEGTEPHFLWFRETAHRLAAELGVTMGEREIPNEFLYLELTDHVTGRKVRVSVPGRYPR
jgi:hypothetical protein